jgi:hypothetical protein
MITFNSQYSTRTAITIYKWVNRPLRTLFCLALFSFALTSVAQTIDLFPSDYQAQWTRVAIPPTNPVSNIAQWHIDPAQRQIVCDGNGGHEWLRFGHELGNFSFHVQWRFTPVTTGKTDYNSGVFFRSDADGNIWHQAQTTQAGGYIFGVTLVDGKPSPFNLKKDMAKNRIKPAGEWNAYDIRCVGDTCSLSVNGELMNTAHVGLQKGYIGLESEGYRIEFKDFKVTLLH